MSHHYRFTLSVGAGRLKTEFLYNTGKSESTNTVGSGPFMEVVDNNTNIKNHRHYTLTIYFSAVMSVSPFKATVEFSSYYLVLCFFV